MEGWTNWYEGRCGIVDERYGGGRRNKNKVEENYKWKIEWGGRKEIKQDGREGKGD